MYRHTSLMDPFTVPMEIMKLIEERGLAQNCRVSQQHSRTKLSLKTQL